MSLRDLGRIGAFIAIIVLIVVIPAFFVAMYYPQWILENHLRWLTVCAIYGAACGAGAVFITRRIFK
jgi:hypothetical protein